MEFKQWRCKNESYEGTFLGDCFHGYGTYKWMNSNVYEGSFYANSRQGYAHLSFPDNSNFEGLFIENQPFGPGVLTYPNGRQDVGFWLGRKLVRLSRPVDYIIPRLAPTLTAKLKLLRFRRMISLNEESDLSVTNILKKWGYETLYSWSPYSRLIYNVKSIFFDKPFFDNHMVDDNKNTGDWGKGAPESTDSRDVSQARSSSLYVHHVCHSDMLMDCKYDDGGGFCQDNENLPNFKMEGILGYYTKHGNLDGIESDIFPDLGFADFGPDDDGFIFKIKGNGDRNEAAPPKILSWNRGDLCTEIIKQIYKYRAHEDKVNFKIAELMAGIRTAFRKTGENERLCLYFLKMCSIGPPCVIKELLCDSEISPELMDCRGNNGLMFASAGDQCEIIDLLSDYGVDVNAFNDENLTPLNLCLLRRLALKNGIYNWETAFLRPKEDDNVEVEELDGEDLQRQETISSLDRIFGEGMSVFDHLADDIPVTHEESLTAAQLVQIERRSTSSKSLDGCERSHITILNFKKLLDVESNEVSVIDASFLTGEKNPTMDVKKKKVPKSFKREEYLTSIEFSVDDRYLFDLQLNEILPAAEKGKKGSGKDEKPRKPTIETIAEDDVDVQLLEKLARIDDTIDKLLQRGADPNLSDVPKPSLHLGVFTENPHTVYSLLKYGSDPNRQLSENEGLLTPLHVLVLLKPRLENIEICKLLLKFGANTESETHPDFSMREDESDFLNQSHGRTPLQLLCMRPDIEYGDPFGHVISLGVLLAQSSSKDHFFNGHSGLTLAIIYGNSRLLEAFLSSGCFDPNQVLKGLGTPLHILVSTFVQKRTNYDISIKMVDILLDAGADPLLSLKSSSLNQGTCIEYGYTEIEGEKALRRAGQKSKGTATTAGGNRDHLKDHIRVLEYLFKRQQELLNPEMLAGNASSKKTTKSYAKKEAQFEKDSEKSKRVEIGETQMMSEKKSHREMVDTSILDKESAHEAKETKSNVIDTRISKKTRNERKKPKKAARSDLSTTVSGDNETTTEKEKPQSSEQPFSEFLLKSLLELFGNCADFDVNQFALPYVVLRNGNFYYKFQGPKGPRKEQYSLV